MCCSHVRRSAARRRHLRIRCPSTTRRNNSAMRTSCVKHRLDFHLRIRHIYPSSVVVHSCPTVSQSAYVCAPLYRKCILMAAQEVQHTDTYSRIANASRTPLDAHEPTTSQYSAPLFAQMSTHLRRAEDIVHQLGRFSHNHTREYREQTSRKPLTYFDGRCGVY